MLVIYITLSRGLQYGILISCYIYYLYGFIYSNLYDNLSNFVFISIILLSLFTLRCLFLNKPSNSKNSLSNIIKFLFYMPKEFLLILAFTGIIVRGLIISIRYCLLGTCLEYQPYMFIMFASIIPITIAYCLLHNIIRDC